MNAVCKAVSVLIAAVILALAPGAAAQVVGDWETNLGDLRIFRDRTGTAINPNYNMSASGARHEVGPLAFVVMHGKYERLHFKGDWWIMGRPRESDPPRRCVGTRPPLYTSADDTREYGEVIITFNAAENSFTGTVQWHCRSSDGRTRKGPLETLTGTRKGSNMQVYRQPERVNATIDPNPNPGGTPPAPGGRNAREQREWDYRQCTHQLDLFRLNIAGAGSTRQQVSFVRDFQIRPCEIDAAALEKFQIDMLSPPAEKRPSSLILRSIQVEGAPVRGSASDPFLVPVRYLPTTITKPLPFVGVPRAGSSIMNQIMPGNFCNAALWLANLRYSDGTESPPFSLLTSECGVRRHPEQLPADSGGSRPVSRDELKPAKPRS